MIETYLLENLAAFARLGTLSAAADELHVSQPALTRSMQKLEDLLEVPLFDRQKNRITLNTYGRMAAEHAERILEQEDEMIRLLRSAYRASRTISLGSCAPAPLWQLQPMLTRLYSDMAVSAEIQEDDLLWKGLQEDTYQLVILREEPQDPWLYCTRIGEEHLNIALPPHHPLAGQESLTLSEIDGITVLQQTVVGFWLKVCREKMPHARFLLQDERETFMEIINASSLPTFSTDLSLKLNPERAKTRVHIPLTDPEVNVTFYLACRQEHKARFRALFKEATQERRTE